MALKPGVVPSEEGREGRHCYNTIYGSASSNSSSQCADLASPSSEPLADAHQRKPVTPSPLELGTEPGRAGRQSPNAKWEEDCPSTRGKLEPGTPCSDCVLQVATETQKHKSCAPSALLKHCRLASKHPWPQAQARSEHSLGSGCLRLAKGAAWSIPPRSRIMDWGHQNWKTEGSCRKTFASSSLAVVYPTTYSL